MMKAPSPTAAADDTPRRALKKFINRTEKYGTLYFSRCFFFRNKIPNFLFN